MSQWSAFRTGHIISSRFPAYPKIKVGLHEAPQQFGPLSEKQGLYGTVLHLPGCITDKPGDQGLNCSQAGPKSSLSIPLKSFPPFPRVAFKVLNGFLHVNDPLPVGSAIARKHIQEVAQNGW